MIVQRGHPPIGYCTATTAKRRLGNISDGKLRYYVQQGKVERLVPPGMGQGFYKREDVDNLVKVIDEFYTEPGEPGPRFMVATEQDIRETVNLLIGVFGGGDTVERRMEWIQRNPEVAFIERNKVGGKIVGCVFAPPLTEEKIYQLFDDPTPSTRLVNGDDIQQYRPGQPACIFIMGMAVRSQTGFKIKRARGSTLIRGILRFLVNLGQRGIEIKLLAARSDTRDGINLLKRLGFTEIVSTTNERNFIIDVEQSGIPLIQPYKAALAKWKVYNN